MERYIIKNEKLEVHILSYGGTIEKILCQDKDGHVENVVLTYHNKEDYINVPGPYLNALVGPTAGRVAYGKYGQRQLSCNNGVNHLHGGFEGISFDEFTMEQESENKLVARLTKTHEKDGYHGQFDYQIIYLLEDDKLILMYDISCSEPNLLYLTSHLYFNLSGNLKSDIRSEVLKSNFQQMMFVDETSAPSQIVKIEKNSCFDFSEGKCLGDVLNEKHSQFAYTRGIDHPFFVNGTIILEDPTSGRVLEIESDAPCAVIYSANFIDETMTFENQVKGKLGVGLAIELQDYPNGVNFGLNHERTHYTQKTSYRFCLK